MTVQANELQKSDVASVEELLIKRAKIEAQEAKIKKQYTSKLTPIADEISKIDAELLELAENNKDRWWPDNSKTKEFDSGKLSWRAASSLVTKDGDPLTEKNADLLHLGSRAGCRDLIKITPVLGKIKVLLDTGKMPKGYEDIHVKVVDKFKVETF